MLLKANHIINMSHNLDGKYMWRKRWSEVICWASAETPKSFCDWSLSFMGVALPQRTWLSERGLKPSALGAAVYLLMRIPLGSELKTNHLKKASTVRNRLFLYWGRKERLNQLFIDTYSLIIASTEEPCIYLFVKGVQQELLHRPGQVLQKINSGYKWIWPWLLTRGQSA